MIYCNVCIKLLEELPGLLPYDQFLMQGSLQMIMYRLLNMHPFDQKHIVEPTKDKKKKDKGDLKTYG